jgi:HSP20 family molecular chaperone IbpA
MADQNHNTVYPGQYNPLPFMKNDAIKKSRRSQRVKYSSRLFEYADHYKAEIIAPGHAREEFIVHIKNRKLSIMIMQSRFLTETGNRQQNELDVSCVLQTMKLPSNSDTDFVRAEYRFDILHIYFPKTSRSSPVNATHGIVVY